mgnify:CR=1 FL=1
MSLAGIVALVAVLVVGLSILWSTLRTGMSPMPSLGASRRAMVSMLDETPRGAIVDMGSGWGTLAVAFARRFPDTPVVGYEVSYFPWLFSVLLARAMGLGNLRFRRLDFCNAELMGVSVLVCYLMPSGMERVRQRLETDPGDVDTVISHYFALRGWEADDVVELPDLYRTPLYRYRLSSNQPQAARTMEVTLP